MKNKASSFFRVDYRVFNGGDFMLLFIILAIVAIILTVVTIAVLSTLGAGAIIIFGDVIVCIGIIIWICRKIITKKRN